MRSLFKFKYPKFLGLAVVIILAYFVFRNPAVENFISNLENLSYVWVFIAGLFFSFGFTIPFSIAFFVTLNPENILFTGIIGGIGAMLSDLLIFKLIRFSFKDEIKKLEKEKLIRRIEKTINETLGNRIKHYLLYIFAGIIIASPLPDEAGVMMLASLTRIKTSVLAVLSFFCNTIGIIVLLLI